MIFQLVIFAIYCAFPLKGEDKAEVDYYVKLIQDEEQKILTTRGPKDASEYRPTSCKVTEFGTFDYIVIGAGAAGAVVASRLSENPQNKVLLIEAGGQENNYTDIPAMDFNLVNSPYAWNMLTVPQENACLGMVNHQCVYPRGRGLGGSTIINNLYYVRGNKLDYDSWAKCNPEWSYEDVLPYFLKSENADVNYPNSKYHKRGGSLNVTYNTPLSREFTICVEANLGKKRKFIDYNGVDQVGVARVQYNTINGRRLSTNKAFLKPAYNRSNLKIMTWSYATKINIDKSTKIAYGVTFSHKKRLYLARAAREIILSAGVFQSPQLLMLSGIGPPSQLALHRIPLIQSLAVGYNLQDHQTYSGLLFQSNNSALTKDLKIQVEEYLQGYGDLTFGINSQTIMWFQTKLEKTPNYPDIEAILITSKTPKDISKQFYNYDNETFNAIWDKVNPTRTFSIAILLMRPKSRGTVKLQSADPYVFPLIDPNFNSHSSENMETLYEGVQTVLDLVDTPEFRKINATLYPTNTHPGCRAHEVNSKEYWFCQFRYLVITAFHAVGTCKMGPDPCSGRAVVNHKFQVHGVGHLRVVDASIMPSLITGHTSAPTIMFGEKAAENILNDNE